jgi:hypothetical protein
VQEAGERATLDASTGEDMDMNRRGFLDDAPPWSFFLPITLAVVLGSLIADAVRLATGTVFVRDTVETAAPARTPAKAPAANAVASANENVPATTPSAPGTPTPDTAAADTSAPELPGPISAMRDRDERACIGGSVADRRPNGWEQALEDDAPVRCTATSP